MVTSNFVAVGIRLPDMVNIADELSIQTSLLGFEGGKLERATTG